MIDHHQRDAAGQLGRGEMVEERVVDLDVRQPEEQLGEAGGEQQRAERDEDRLDAHEHDQHAVEHAHERAGDEGSDDGDRNRQRRGGWRDRSRRPR